MRLVVQINDATELQIVALAVGESVDDQPRHQQMNVLEPLVTAADAAQNSSSARVQSLEPRIATHDQKGRRAVVALRFFVGGPVFEGSDA